jgi:hypothetical protein
MAIDTMGIRIATFETKCKFKSTKRIGGFAF